MIYPALGLLVAATLHHSSRARSYIVFAVSSVLLFAITCEKLNNPHGFHEFREPAVRLANTYSTLPELRGLRLPETTVRFIDGTVRIIQQYSRPSDTIFVYPELGVFYNLAERHYPTATDSHNLDVVNDDFARSEAATLLRARPAVIVYYQQPEWSLRSDETLWRGGHRSGQRDLIAAIETLTKQYRLAARFPVPPNEFDVLVYVRP
jgi:hypothetical protein